MLPFLKAKAVVIYAVIHRKVNSLMTDFITVICKELETLVEGNGQPETTL